MDVVQEFFINGRLYRASNCSIVTLIPKSKEANRIKDCMPIACCSTIYKIIFKVLATRMGKVLDTIVGQNQAAFVKGQNIHNQILLTYELIKVYERKCGIPRCLMQMDIQKAYDTVDWKAFGFPWKFTIWIMIFVSYVSYRFNVNEKYTNIMEAKRGLRQGDPILRLLFVIVIECLNKYPYKML